VRALAAAIDALSDAAGYLAAAAMLLLTGMVTAGVVARRVLNAPFLFVEELSGYVVLAIVFLGLAHTFRGGGHIRVDFLLGRTTGTARTALQAACLLVALAWAGFLLAGTWRLVHEYWTQGVRSFAYLQTPLWIPGSLMVVGAVLLVLQILSLLTHPDDAA
jgi:TRAP-type C4-dicarboxylate transport system permease small subunit